MSSAERDALARLIHQDHGDRIGGCNFPPQPGLCIEAGHIADAVIAAGWRPPTEPTAESTAERAGDADDVAVVRLTHDEREVLRPVLGRYVRWESAHDDPVFEAVESILTARFATQPATAPDPEAVKRAHIETAALLGWSTFGTHVDHPEVALEFAGDDGGVPEFERAVPDPEAPLRAKLAAVEALLPVGARSFVDLYSMGAWDLAQRIRAVLGDSGALAEMQARAYDDGYNDAVTMARCYGHTDHWPKEDEPRNPYRAADAGSPQ